MRKRMIVGAESAAAPHHPFPPVRRGGRFPVAAIVAVSVLLALAIAFL